MVEDDDIHQEILISEPMLESLVERGSTVGETESGEIIAITVKSEQTQWSWEPDEGGNCP